MHENGTTRRCRPVRVDTHGNHTHVNDALWPFPLGTYGVVNRAGAPAHPTCRQPYDRCIRAARPAVSVGSWLESGSCCCSLRHSLDPARQSRTRSAQPSSRNHHPYCRRSKCRCGRAGQRLAPPGVAAADARWLPAVVHLALALSVFRFGLEGAAASTGKGTLDAEAIGVFVVA